MEQKNNMEPKKRPTRRWRAQQVNIPNKKVKQWTKAWWKGLLIWIWIFFFFVIFLIFGFFFYLTTNPNSAKSMGIWPSTVKSITSIFAWLIFWGLFILFLILGLINLYKVFTKKEGKTKSIISLVVIFLLWLINITLWWLVYSKIAKIKVWNIYNSNSTLIWYANYLDKDLQPKYVISYENRYPIIAPAKITFKLNSQIYMNRDRLYLIRKEWWIKEKNFVVDCWNWQKLTYPVTQNLSFSTYNYCLFLKKWEHTVKLSLIYDTNKEENKVYKFKPVKINIASAIKFKSNYKLNSNKSEIILWEKWQEVRLDISNLPWDLDLEKNDIKIDFEWKWNFVTYKWIAKYTYNNDGKYNIVFTIPDVMWAPNYYFPIRIMPSTKPLCKVSFRNVSWKYYFKIKWEKIDAPIVWYKYKLVKVDDGNIIYSSNWYTRRTMFKYSLKNGYDYQLLVKVKDAKWKIWSCKSDIIKLSDKLNYSFDVLVNKEKIKNNTIKVWKIPYEYNLEVKNIKSDNDSTPDVKVGFDLDNDMQIDEVWKEYSFKITEKKDKIINVIVEDDNWNKNIKTLHFRIDLKPIIWKFIAEPDIGEAPLNVKLDASQSEVTNNGDEIVYFNWDFGDGSEKNNQTSQWVIYHEYKEAWKYTAKVTIETKKWYKITLTKQIFVKKPVNKATIIFPNNLGWTAEVDYPVKMMVNTSGSVKNIKWDFGDWEKFDCDGRSCSSISHTYKKTWSFKVKVEINYSDWSPVVYAYWRIYITK